MYSGTKCAFRVLCLEVERSSIREHAEILRQQKCLSHSDMEKEIDLISYFLRVYAQHVLICGVGGQSIILIPSFTLSIYQKAKINLLSVLLRSVQKPYLIFLIFTMFWVFFFLNTLLKNKAKPNKQNAKQTISKKGNCWKDTNLFKQGTPKKFP